MQSSSSILNNFNTLMPDNMANLDAPLTTCYFMSPKYGLVSWRMQDFGIEYISKSSSMNYLPMNYAADEENHKKNVIHYFINKSSCTKNQDLKR